MLELLRYDLHRIREWETKAPGKLFMQQVCSTALLRNNTWQILKITNKLVAVSCSSPDLELLEKQSSCLQFHSLMLVNRNTHISALNYEYLGLHLHFQYILFSPKARLLHLKVWAITHVNNISVDKAQIHWQRWMFSNGCWRRPSRQHTFNPPPQREFFKYCPLLSFYVHFGLFIYFMNASDLSSHKGTEWEKT